MTTTFAHVSPGGGTRRYGGSLGAALGPVVEVDLLPPDARRVVRRFGPDDRLVVAAPVHKGRLPAVDLCGGLVGDRTPAYAVVVYGNRDYTDALAELADTLAARGFRVCGAAAVVAQHTYTAALAPGRPTPADADELARHVAAAFAADHGGAGVEASVPGQRPYRTAASGRKVTPEVTDDCTLCGDCAGQCPVDAIPPAAPDTTLLDVCLGCGRCLVACPEDARRWGGDHAVVRAWLEANFTAPRVNAYF